MENWRLEVSPKQTGRSNMQTDLQMFSVFEEGNIAPTLRIYSWQPRCITVGYGQKLEKQIDLEKAQQLGWDVIQRPTGGGIVFHNEAEVTYSLVMAMNDPILPKGLVPAYKKISEAVVAALNYLGIKAGMAKIQDLERRASNDGLCFSYPAEYEIVVGSKKIVGSAQKRGQRALLQQGSIFVRKNDPKVFSVLKNDCGIENSVSVEELLGRAVGFDALCKALKQGFQECLDI
ncbi:hypothetical protein A3J44_05440 [candidate division WOR-1 bacterium RIFCSPHIGHO2_02_FULL_45_12]|nr:MAG: hypothetical protein A3J44_05440 [candidate division WOR-1 bacterium RIFCSPHIGHO2_02_FULL_45_12]